MEQITLPSEVGEIQHAASSSVTTLAGVEPVDKKSLASPEQTKAQLPSRNDDLAFSRSPTMVVPETPSLPSNFRRYVLLAIFSCAQFFDVYSASAVIIALTDIGRDLNMSAAETIWNTNAYSLTLAAFLLAAGRVSDIVSAKWTFVVGFAWVGIFSLGIGFSKDKVTIIVLRAFSGIGASATIPASLNLIVNLFPEEKEQARAISIFGGMGAIANVTGLLIGGILLLADWTWIFWLVTMITIPGSILAAFLIPSPSALPCTSFDVENTSADGPAAGPAPKARKPKMDYVGLLFLTAAIVLLIFGVSNGNTEGWRTAQTIAPLIIGGLLFPAFFYWETRMDAVDALIPSKTWSIPNFALLAVLALVPYFWWFVFQVVFSELFQREWGIGSIMTAVRFLPNGIAGGAVIMLNGWLPARFTLKWRIIVGALGATAGGLLLSFASSRHFYWPLIFPGLIIGSASMALTYTGVLVAIMVSAPPEMAGVSGGIANSAFQLGTAVFLSISTSIQTSYPEPSNPAVPSWQGYQASMLFAVGLTFMVAPLTFFFFKDPMQHAIEGSAAEAVIEKRGEEESNAVHA